MKKCELCNSTARMYCHSDKAGLCWDCDARVHAAHFLAAKHSRTLLCHSCQSPTPWTGSGTRLEPTITLCRICANKDITTPDHHHNQYGENDHRDSDIYDDSEDEEEELDDDEDEDEGENQVVPLSSSSMNKPREGSSTRDFRVREASIDLFSRPNKIGL